MRGGMEGGTPSLMVGDAGESTVPHKIIALVTELHQRLKPRKFGTELGGELAAQRERPPQAAYILQKLFGCTATADEARQRARITEERADAAHPHAAEVTAVIRVAKAEHIRQTQISRRGGGRGG